MLLYINIHVVQYTKYTEKYMFLSLNKPLFYLYSYTGLPSIVFLMGMFEILKDGASNMKYWTRQSSSDSKKWQEGNWKKPGRARKLSLFEEFVLTLLRFRLGISTQFLGMLFGVSQSTVSSIFTSWMSLMDQVLSPLLKWPSRQKIMKHLPLAFRLKYPKTRVIIDATEFYIQRPRNPTAQSKTWSNYKNKNTFKALVGVTPNGAFSFVSELWSGNTSDRCITEKSGFLDLIERDDHVMADRGFLINDLLLRRGACLNMPPFTRQCIGKGKGKFLVVGKGRFWHTSIFRIGFSFDDVSSNRTVPESALESDADSGISFDDVTSTRCSRDDLWRRRLWHSSIFRIRFWCDDVSGVRNGPRHLRFWVILVRPWWSRAAVFHCDILNPAQGLNIYIW